MAAPQQKPNNRALRVLHIAFTMHARGTETWLMNLLRRIDPKKVSMDFVTIEDEVGVYDEEIKRLGGTLHACPHPKNKGAFLRRFREVLDQHGPYDVVHAHPYTMAGPIMLQSMRAGVPVRITHSHTDRRKARRDKSFIRRIYGWFMRKLIDRLSTYGLAASQQAAEDLFGQYWQEDKRWNVMYCGVDLRPFENRPSTNFKKELGIPAKSKVIGHVGSFHFEKNHDFILRLFSHMAKKDMTLILLLVGDGPLKEKIADQVIAMGLENRVIMTGVREDISNLLSVMDIFLFPSLFEGLGLSLIEAQAAGIRCLVSDVVPREASVNDDLVTFLPLDEEAQTWASAVKIILDQKPVNAQKALDIIKKSQFNIDHNAIMLTELYQTLCSQKKQVFS